MSNENSALKLFTKHPKSTGLENSGPERTDFGHFGGPAVNSPAATTLENNEKFCRETKRRTGCAGTLAEERELGSSILWGVTH